MYKFSKSKMKRGISHNLKQVQKRVTETFSVSTCIEQNIIKESTNFQITISTSGETKIGNKM